MSYGTFSCTLEGFDDPFSTMKSIAEYFRDLAADDRYFGAEPPQPDAAMLHRIAEREVQRRVEAHVAPNSVILRTGDSVAPVAPPPAVAPSVRPAALSDSVAAKLQRLRDAARAPIAAEVAPAAPVSVLTVATQPAPVRPAPDPAYLSNEPAPAAFAPQVIDPAPLDGTADSDAVVVDEPATFDAPAAAEVAAPAEVAATDPETLQADADDEPPVAEEHTAPVEIAESAALDAAPDLTPADVPEDEIAPPAVAEVAGEHPEAPGTDVAAAGAVVEAAAAEAADDVDVAPAAPFEDAAAPVAEAAEPPDEQAEDDISSLMAAIAAPSAPVETRAEDTPGPLPALIGDDGAADAMLSALIADHVEAAPGEAAQMAESATFATADDTWADDMADADGAPEPVAAVEAPLDAAPAVVEFMVAELVVTEEAVIETPDVEAEAVAPAPGAVFADVAPQDDARSAEASAPPAPVDAETALAAALAEPLVEDGPSKLQRARARVIKIRRVEPVAAPARHLSPEAEAALAAELAALATETPAKGAQLSEPAGEQSVQRLIDEANTQLEGPENRRRLSAIAHLKAAVAATVADRRAAAEAGTPAAPENRDAPYRSDLERVVRPRRPVSGVSTGTERPADRPSARDAGVARLAAEDPATPPRPAPLVLVSAQRIDRPRPAVAAAPVGPVRPRRPGGSASLALSPVTDEDDEDDEDEDANLFTTARGFAEFAERLGAQDLAELLEAAVAYAACIEGRPHVSRPQMMRHVGSVRAETEIPREDMLRSFGSLMRAGRIEKVRPGQFALPESSRLLAEARRIAH